MTEQLAWTACDRYENGDVRRLRKLERSRPIDVSVALTNSHALDLVVF